MEIPYFVHGGFLKCWKAVEDIVIEKIKEKGANGAYKWNRVIVVGYSHGAALAALCHECVWFHREDLRIFGLQGVGFDGPRIYAGFKVRRAIAERWEHFTMYRNCNDIVTHLPPVLFGFRHVGNLIEIRSDKWVNCFKAHYQSEIRKSLKAYDPEEWLIY